jgi:hypothetical protein
MATLKSALLTIVASVLASATAAQQPNYVALITKTGAHLPGPEDGILTVTLNSGAVIKLPAADIDYEKTAAYTNRVIITPNTATEMEDKASGRKYLNLTFEAGFVATAWLDDVDFDEVRNNFPTYSQWKRASITVAVTLANYNRLKEGMSLSDVEEYLGRGTQATSSGIGEYTGELYEWRGPHGAAVTVAFSGGKLSAKSQTGLR